MMAMAENLLRDSNRRSHASTFVGLPRHFVGTQTAASGKLELLDSVRIIYFDFLVTCWPVRIYCSWIDGVWRTGNPSSSVSFMREIPQSCSIWQWVGPSLNYFRVFGIL